MKKYFFMAFLVMAMFWGGGCALAAQNTCCSKTPCACVKGKCCVDGKCACKGNCCGKDGCRCADAKGCTNCGCQAT